MLSLVLSVEDNPINSYNFSYLVESSSTLISWLTLIER